MKAMDFEVWAHYAYFSRETAVDAGYIDNNCVAIVYPGPCYVIVAITKNQHITYTVEYNNVSFEFITIKAAAKKLYNDWYLTECVS